ncbi:terminase small subunit [Thermodesulfobacteriota bacterium]
MGHLLRRRNKSQGLTEMQKAFVNYYLIHLSGKRAAIAAGYSEKTAEQQASRLLSKVKIRSNIDARMKERAKRINLSQDKVLRDLEFTRLKALEAKHYGTAVKCSELMGRHLGMWRDNILIEDERHLDMKRKETELIEKLKKLAGINNGTTVIKPAEIEYQPQ